MLRPLALVLAAPALASAQTFGPLESLSTGVRNAETVRAVDLDGDGDLDVVSCSPWTNEIVWFENEGGGAIGVRHLVTSSIPEPVGVAPIDVDADGDEDLLVSSGSQVWSLENLGGVEFGTPMLLIDSAFLGPRIEVADLDGDGDLDAIVPQREDWPYSPGALLVENLGGVLATPRAFLPYSGATHVVPFDVDADGRLDLITSGPYSEISWHLNLGGLTYSAASEIDNTFFPVHQIEVGDLDGDGDGDIVAARRGSAEIVVFENLGGAGFGPRIQVDAGTDSAPELALTDVDADGDLDIVAGVETDPTPIWIENQGGLTLTPRGAILSTPLVVPTSIVAIDLDGDGAVTDDLLMALDDGSIQWLRAAPPASSGPAYESATRPIAVPIDTALDLAALDVDGDGDTDVVAASPTEGLVLCRRLGVDGYGVPEPLLPQLGGVRWVVAADLDGDGDADLALRSTDNRIQWIETGPQGLGAATVVDSMPGGTFAGPWPIDYDQDGDLDLLGGTPYDDTIVVHEQTAPGTFAARRVVGDGNVTLSEIDAGDLDGDGILDLVARRNRSGIAQVTWLRGTGGGQFELELIVNTGSGGVRDIAVGDLDFDLVDEVVWITHGGMTIEWIQIQPGGAIDAPRVALTLDGRGEHLALTDVDGNGNLDVVFATDPQFFGGRDLIEWAPYAGIVQFGPIETLTPLTGRTSRLKMADLDGDGDPDVLGAWERDDRVTSIENLSRVPLGVNYCGPAVANSTGKSAAIRALGARTISTDDVQLQAYDLPPGAMTLFLTSRTQGLAMNPGGSQGTLCLGGAIGRFAGPGQVGAATQDGVSTLRIDLSALPQPTGAVSAMSSELWRFQAWYRDSVGGAATSNFTDAVAVVFL